MKPLKEFTQFWRAPEYGDLEMLRARYVTHRFVPHYHETYGLGVIERGAEVFDYANDSHVSVPGQVMVLNPFEVHTGEALNELGWVYRMIYPPITLMRQIATEMTGRLNITPYFGAPVINDPELAGLVLLMHQRLEQSANRLERDSLLHAALGILVQRHAQQKLHVPFVDDAGYSVQRVRDYLDAHFAENTPLETLATIGATSPFHLIRIFRKATGLTPHQYQNQRRVAQAQTLLRSGMPISQVATEAGFSDQSHLTRRFKERLGVTPGQYARHNHSA